MATSSDTGALMTLEENIDKLAQEIRQSITEESAVPRNVRAKVKEALEKYLLNQADEVDMRAYSTISVLEEQINDTNLPPHARTRLFEFIRDLENVVRQWEAEMA